jgi:hypothetical protein
MSLFCLKSSQEAVLSFISSLVSFLSNGNDTSEGLDSLGLFAMVEHLWVKFYVRVRLVLSGLEHISLSFLTLIHRARLLEDMSAAGSLAHLFDLLLVTFAATSRRIILLPASLDAEVLDAVFQLVELVHALVTGIAAHVFLVTVAEDFLMLAFEDLVLSFIIRQFLKILDDELVVLLQQYDIIFLVCYDVFGGQLDLAIEFFSRGFLPQLDEGILDEMRLQFLIISLNNLVHLMLGVLQFLLKRDHGRLSLLQGLD